MTKTIHQTAIGGRSIHLIKREHETEDFVVILTVGNITTYRTASRYEDAAGSYMETRHQAIELANHAAA